MTDKLEQQIEALIFASEAPVTVKEMQAALKEAFEADFKAEEIEEAIERLRQKYADEAFAFEVVPIAGGYQFMSKGAYHPIIGVWLKQRMKKRLSRAALETLAIIAYKQPVAKSEMEKIRGVSCDYSVQKLLEKELVTIVGRGEGPGKPLLYGTSEKFMDYFGIKDIGDLPKPKDFKTPDSEIGEQAPIEEEVANGAPAAGESPAETPQETAQAEEQQTPTETTEPQQQPQTPEPESQLAEELPATPQEQAQQTEEE